MVRGVGAEIAFNSSGGAADWIMLMPLAGDGMVRTFDGRGPYRVSDAGNLASASLQAHHGRIPLDENHSTDLAAPNGGPSPARGWIVDMQARAEGIFGHIKWNASGAALMSEQAYRFISPVLILDKSGNVLDMPRASLTNTPNLRGMAALHAQENFNMDLMAQLRKLLGLADDADESAVVAKVREVSGETTAMQSIAVAAGLARDSGSTAVLNAVKTLKDGVSLASIAKAAGLKDDADMATITTAVTKLAGGMPDNVKALQSELADTTTKLNALTQQTAQDKAQAFIDSEIAKGRIGLNSMRDHYITRHAASAEGAASVVKEISAMPIVPPGELPSRDVTHSTELNSAELASAASRYQRDQAAAGQPVDYATAVRHVADKGATKR